MVQVRIVAQIFGARDRRERDRDLVTDRGHLCLGVLLDDAGNQCEQGRAFRNPSLVGFVVGIVEEIGTLELPAEPLPVLVTRDADEDLVALGGLEWLVDGPCPLANRHWRHRAARDRLARDVLSHQERGGFEQRRFYLLAAAGAFALAQGGEDADRGKGPAHDVDDRSARPQGAPGGAGHVGEPPHELRHLVQRRAVLIGAAQKPLQGAEDNTGIDLA